MTAASLRALTCKDLGRMAKKEGVAGWHSMRKEQLIRALVRASRRKAKNNNGASHGTRGRTSHRTPAPRTTNNPRVAKRIKKMQSAQELLKLISTKSNGAAGGKDRLVVLVRGPYWLHANWELRRESVERAAAALGQNWHTARPILRLLAVSSSGTTSTSERVLRDIDIHGGVNDWYINLQNPPGTYQVEIGYLTEGGQLYSLARSNIVSTPPPSDADSLDQNWDEVAENCDKIFAMSGGLDGNGSASDLRELFEERLRRPMGAPLVTRYVGAKPMTSSKDLHFEVDAEMIVYGTASPDALVTIKGQPIELREDGSFTVRMSMPDRRQVIPVVADRADGVEQQTIVIAVERNTKVMETLIRNPEEPVSS